MKKLLVKIGFTYGMFGLVLGIFYREFTKFNHFSGKTVLGGLHTHALALGALFFLIVLLLEKSYELSTHRKFKKFLIENNIGLLALIVMMGVRGVLEVLNTNIPTWADYTISGLAGVSHIIMAEALYLFFMIIFNKVDESEKAQN